MYDIDKREVLRYLGFRTDFRLDEELGNRVDSLIRECEGTIVPNFVWNCFDVSAADNMISVCGTDITLEGCDIFHHLAKCSMCALMAVTLGAAADRKFMYYEKKSMADAVIFDSVCTAFVECAADECEAQITEYAKTLEMSTNFRYSPGYGDFPLDVQKKILSVLNAEKRLGLTATDTYLMIPRKSVTAVVGIY